MFDHAEEPIDQCRKNAEGVLHQCRENQGIGDTMIAILEESANILQGTGRKVDDLAKILYSWRDRALAAEDRVRELEAQHRTEMCEAGYDCVELGEARKAAIAAEERAKKAEKERDAAIEDISILAEHFYFEANGKNPCIICDNRKRDCTFCDRTLGFRWRGVKEE